MNTIMTGQCVYKTIFILIIFLGPSASLLSQSKNPIFYKDTLHHSQVFGHDKYYRVYLPAGYGNTAKKYPVIYFFHGWGGRHFKDESALLDYEKIKTLVDKYQLILVMWDGNIDTTEPRPYNTGDHEHVKYNVQMKDYFPELVGHIDSSYSTLPDRQHRGIIGFSMGGFMSFFLAGKYPDKVIAAVSLAGSPEFFIGHPDNHTLYPVRYMFSNLQDVSIRLHNGDSDILYYLNHEVQLGAKWEGIPLDYWKFHGGHMVDKPGEVKVFESALRFVKTAFDRKSESKSRWSHTDLYPEFTIWDYIIKTNKNEPGYISITNVDKGGFGLYQRKWLPDGPPLNTGPVQVITAPIYRPGKKYNVVSYVKRTGQVGDNKQQADIDGRLSFLYDQQGIETGIYDENDGASFIVLDHTTGNNSRFLHNGRKGLLSLKLFNRGNTSLPAGKISVLLSSTDTAVHFPTSKVEVNLKPGQRIIGLPPFSIACNKKLPQHAEPPQLNITATIRYGKQSFKDRVIVPVLYDSPLLDSIQVDDQRIVRDRPYGTGNGNGIADAGEKIMLYTGKHRLRLYTEDKWVIRDESELADEMIPAIWPDGFTMNSIAKISPDCPDGHTIEFYGSFETKSFSPIERKTSWGIIKIRVRNERKPN